MTRTGIVNIGVNPTDAYADLDNEVLGQLIQHARSHPGVWEIRSIIAGPPDHRGAYFLHLLIERTDQEQSDE